MSSDMLQDRVQSMSSDRDKENYVRGHGTHEITCQATCHERKDERSMSSDIAQRKLRARYSQMTIIHEIY